MTKKQQLLVLDNSGSLVSPWKKYLTENYELIESVGGFEAVTKLRSNAGIKVVIINSSLTYFNPIEAVDKIRDKFRQIPIIVLYDPKDAQVYRNMQQYKIDAMIKLPMDVSQLAGEVTKFAPVDAPQSSGMSMQTDPEIAAKIAARAQAAENQAAAAAPSNGDDEDLEKKYYAGQSAIMLGNIDEAIRIFEDMINLTSIKKEGWRRYVEQALYQLGICYAKKNAYDKSTDYYSKFVKRAPHNDLVKEAILNVGINWEAQGDIQKAVNFYKKVISMPPLDSVTTRARKYLKKVTEGV